MNEAWFGYIWFEPGNFLVHNRTQGFPANWARHALGVGRPFTIRGSAA